MIIELDSYIEHIEIGARQQPKLTAEQQKELYWEQKTFEYFRKLMQPGWLTYKPHDVY